MRSKYKIILGASMILAGLAGLRGYLLLRTPALMSVFNIHTAPLPPAKLEIHRLVIAGAPCKGFVFCSDSDTIDEAVLACGNVPCEIQFPPQDWYYLSRTIRIPYRTIIIRDGSFRAQDKVSVVFDFEPPMGK